jgi:NACHT domain
MEDSASSLPNHNSAPSPQIQQNVGGDGNQVNGQVTGGNVFGNINGNVTINEGVPVSSVPLLTGTMPTLTQQEHRQRQVLLDKMRKFWIKGVLENSLHTRALIELGLQERLDLVQRPFSGVDEFPETAKPLPIGTNTTKFFDQIGEGRTLLILGAPGSGKTIALLKLAEDLIIRIEPDLLQPIPVVFNLSSWAGQPQTLENWLVQELQEKYQVSKVLGETWVKSEALILLLDGLDEVQAGQRNACVQALNLFMQSHGTTEIVVCCRIQDYQLLADRLALRSAIRIQPLTPGQINSYFEQAGEPLSALKTVLQQDKVLQELATSPLMLSIMSVAYQGFTQNQLVLGGNIEDYRKRLFEIYIDRMLQRRGATQQYSKEETQRWLIWLAKQMKEFSRTLFLIEQLQPCWLITKKQLIQYYIQPSLADKLITQILLRKISTVEAFYISSGDAIKYCRFGLITSLLTGVTYSILPESYQDKSFKLFFNSTISYIKGSPVHPNDFSARLLTGIAFGLILSLQSSLVMLLTNGLSTTEIQQTTKPNEGIHRSIINASILMIMFALAMWLVNQLMIIANFEFVTLNGFIFFGLIGWLIGGGYTSFRHFILRIILYSKKYSPWNYARFLDYAAERIFLQKVGGGYIFVHRMLLEHFAGMSLEQEEH